MVDLGGYVIILVETKDKKIKLYGSPADNDDLEVGDEILEVNGKTLEDATHTEVISHIHQCIRSRTICLRVKRRSGARLAVDLDLCSSNVQDAFVIAVEQQARERLERLSALKRITPVDMTKLSQQLNQQSAPNEELNGFISNSPIYVTSLTATENPSSVAARAGGVGGGVGGGGAVLSGTTSVVAVNKATAAQQQQQQQQRRGDTTAGQARKGGAKAAAAVPNDVRAAPHAHAPPDQKQPALKNEGSPPQTLGVRSLGDRRASSPFQNGRTELLIGNEDNKLKTTAIVESNNNKLSVDAESRPRRRSGSAIVVLDGDLELTKRPPDDDDEFDAAVAVADGMVTMLAGGGATGENDGGGGGGTAQPHREMAVDVPDTFVARNKTPPRYPPPKPTLPVSYNRHGSEERAIDVPDNFLETNKTPKIHPSPIKAGLNGSTPQHLQQPAAAAAAKPVPPPRDHLKVEKDGRIVNRAPAPQVPARLNNNNVAAAAAAPPTPTHPAPPAPPATPTAVVEPTREQLDSIKKYQEQIRKRKEEEERLAAQTEFLNRSLRGSRKLQALEKCPQGTINDAFEDELQRDADSALPAEKEREQVHLSYAYGELVAAGQRLHLQLKKAAAGGGLGGLEGRIAAVQSLLLSPQFGRALAVHNAVQAARARAAQRQRPAAAQAALRDALDALAASQSAYAVELATLLTGYEFEALMVAHDGVATTLPADPLSPVKPTRTEASPTVSSGGRYGEENIKIIRVEKSTEPLGATVRNEGDAVVIGRVVRGGAAEKSGLLHEGDEILEVNGIEMRGKSVNAVCDILKDMEGSLTILIVPASQARSHLHRDMVLHVRALFDYDPEDDMYIPCRELGISFRKGDVLHIISQEDPNWWQAYREGEEDQTLAGLVPSLSFQHQRESMRLAAEERMTKPQKKSSTLLCGTTAKRKKKKGAYDEGGYPMYTNDEYETDEILTYEEVSLYYPRANKKRPIVLIGPPDIGRHELRQRLMEDSERFAAAIPHTSRARKENEVDGQDYHFITRAQFEADILSRKFVEHGEYEKAYYGTSLDAIRSVVNSGKICVLNLHPQSLKILRTSDLKPYVVFVAPPNLENLKIKKDRLGDTYKEEELVDIIEKAREMEKKYGHFFDMIIINNDTERAYHDLLSEINSLEREPQWVPAAWVKAP